MQSTTTADDTLKYLFLFADKVRLKISCELSARQTIHIHMSARQTIHMKCQVLVSLKNKINFRMSTATMSFNIVL